MNRNKLFSNLVFCCLLGRVVGQDTDGTSAGIIVPVVVAVVFVVFLIIKSVWVVKQREVLIIERFGKYHSTQLAGVCFLIPFVDRPKRFWEKYYVSDNYGRTELRHFTNVARISTQSVVMDFPKQKVITRDNAALALDAILSYKIVNPRQMIYSVQNLPNVLSKLMQAQLRAVAGSLEVDQIIEESTSLHVLTDLLDTEASRWGVKIIFVKVQRVEAIDLEDVLAKKKAADLKNKEVIIGAKAHKQTAIIEAEGYRDSIIKQAEGQAQEVLSRARGDAQAIINFANAEARTIKEIARAIQKDGTNPTRYLLATKYLECLQEIVSTKNTAVNFLPPESAYVQTVQDLGFNSILPPKQSMSS